MMLFPRLSTVRENLFNIPDFFFSEVIIRLIEEKYICLSKFL